MLGKFRHILKRPALYIVAPILALGLPALLHTVSAGQADPGILRPEDLPADAVVLIDDPSASSKIEHPLSSGLTSSLRTQFSSEEQSLLLRHKSMRSFAAILPAQGIVVFNFVYQYATATEAEQAAKVLQSDINGAATLFQVKDFDFKEAKGLQGRGFLLQGNAGDSVYWFVGSRGQHLVLLMVNGMERSSVSSVFESMIQKLMTK